jgi:proline iminopeptidase
VSDSEVARTVHHPNLAEMVYTLALIENHYMANGCFLEEGELLENVDRIKEISTVLVNGRYDMICPPVNAYRLHRRLNKSRLEIIEEAGHSMGEPGITKTLLKVMREYERTRGLID